MKVLFGWYVAVNLLGIGKVIKDGMCCCLHRCPLGPSTWPVASTPLCSCVVPSEGRRLYTGADGVARRLLPGHRLVESTTSLVNRGFNVFTRGADSAAVVPVT